MKIRHTDLMARCMGRCYKLMLSPHRHHLMAHSLEVCGAGLAIVQEGIIAHLLLFGGAGLLLALTLMEELK